MNYNYGNSIYIEQIKITFNMIKNLNLSIKSKKDYDKFNYYKDINVILWQILLASCNDSTDVIENRYPKVFDKFLIILNEHQNKLSEFASDLHKCKNMKELEPFNIFTYIYSEDFINLYWKDIINKRKIPMYFELFIKDDCWHKLTYHELIIYMFMTKILTPLPSDLSFMTNLNDNGEIYIIDLNLIRNILAIQNEAKKFDNSEDFMNCLIYSYNLFLLVNCIFTFNEIK